MKSKIISALLSFGLILTLISGLQAVPKYTDKETALRLAKDLDEGTYGRYTITSTYVQNEDINNYYISVILSDGSAKKWYIDEIYKWSRDDRLILSNNKALLFPDLHDSKFFILDKNDFHKLALQANVFIKEYPQDDPLHGQTFRFMVKNFSLISPTETAFGRDKTGSKFRYIIDLYNGDRELLTYEDAFRIQMQERLLIEKDMMAPTFEKAYHITRIMPHSKEMKDSGVSQFGVEIQFNQSIILTGEHFPYEIYEMNTYDKRTKKNKREFFIDFTIPNSIEKFDVKPIKNLEYLYNVHLLKDPKYPRRLIIRSAFNPSVMDIPPLVYKNSENSVFINFFNLVDQSVLSRGMLLEASQRIEAEQGSLKEIKIDRVIKKESDYSRAFIAATELYKESQAIREPLPKIQKLLIGIKQFEKSALLAEKDSQLYSALMQRNKLRNTVIMLSLDYVKNKLATESVETVEVTELIGMLDQAESFTRSQKVIKNIEVLRDKLSALQ
jgi:hypothetical protein